MIRTNRLNIIIRPRNRDQIEFDSLSIPFRIAVYTRTSMRTYIILIRDYDSPPLSTLKYRIASDFNYSSCPCTTTEYTRKLKSERTPDDWLTRPQGLESRAGCDTLCAIRNVECAEWNKKVRYGRFSRFFLDFICDPIDTSIRFIGISRTFANDSDRHRWGGRNRKKLL